MEYTYIDDCGVNGKFTYTVQVSYSLPAAQFGDFLKSYREFIQKAYAVNNALCHDLFFSAMEDGRFKIFGSDRLAHDLEPDEPIYIQLSDLDELEKKVDNLKVLLETIADESTQK
jgi:hypothetical protein